MDKRKNAADQPAQSHERQLRFGSMMRKLLLPSGSRRWITPIVMLLLLLGIIAGAFIVSSVTQRHVQLDDGTVWITSLKDRKAARFNAKNKDVDAGVSSAASRFDVAQHDGDTVISEGTKASNIAASTISETGNTAIKTDIETIIGGNTAAFINTKTGNVWVGSAADVKSVNPTTDKPNMKLGSGGKIAVTHDGTVYGYRTSDGAVLSIKGPQDTREQVGTIGGAPHAESFTVIGETPVVAAKGTVYWPQGSAAINLQGSMTLQAPSTDGKQNGWVAVATPRGLATVNLSTKKTSETPNSGKGEAAQPVSTGGCVFAAWAQKANNYAKVCSVDGSDTAFDTLTNINATSELIFRTNHRLVILNDVVNGNVWNPQESTKVIKIQWNKVETKQSKQQEQNNDSANNQHNFSKTCSSQSGQIKAEDDSFGARTGSQQILDVLRNDEQTDCSVLRITSVSAPDGANISVSPVYDGRYLQLDASAASEGSVSFSYEISDGRGQTSNANVSLTLVGGDDNAPQQTDTPPEIDVEQGAAYTTNALGSFSDPDGDPLTLVSATPQNTDQVTVSTRADGQLVFNAGSMSSGRAGIEVTVSDGQQTGTGMVYFSVKPANTLAAVIDPAVKQTTPDTRTTIALKQYVHGTSAEPAQLTAVETPSGASTTMNATDMSFTFSASNPGTYYVPYTITQGSIPSTGLARIEVQAVTGDSAKPIAANDVALLGADNTAIVEPLSNDVDPMGGVLSVTSVTADAASGIKTGVVSNKRVYITARQVPTEPVQIKYSVANAAGTSTGVIVLQPPALTTSNSVPKADNITTQVRTDGIVSIDVLDHVTYSDGTTVSLQNDLQYDKKHVQRTRIRIRQHRTIPSIRPNRILPRNVHRQRQSRQRGIRHNHHQRASKRRFQQGCANTIRRRGASRGRPKSPDPDHLDRHRRRRRRRAAARSRQQGADTRTHQRSRRHLPGIRSLCRLHRNGHLLIRRRRLDRPTIPSANPRRRIHIRHRLGRIRARRRNHIAPQHRSNRARGAKRHLRRQHRPGRQRKRRIARHQQCDRGGQCARLHHSSAGGHLLRGVYGQRQGRIVRHRDIDGERGRQRHHRTADSIRLPCAIFRDDR